MVHARDRFSTLVKESWGPEMRALGMKGSGQRWTLPHDDLWALLGFQSSMGSTSALVRFTLNLSVTDKAEYAAYRATRAWVPERPSATTRTSVELYAERAGAMTHGHDHWWEVPALGPVGAVRDELLGVLRHAVVPALVEACERGRVPCGRDDFEALMDRVRDAEPDVRAQYAAWTAREVLTHDGAPEEHERRLLKLLRDPGAVTADIGDGTDIASRAVAYAIAARDGDAEAAVDLGRLSLDQWAGPLDPWANAAERATRWQDGLLTNARHHLAYRRAVGRLDP